MRWANFVEGLLFMVGFLAVCLAVLTSRPLQPLPVRRLRRHIPVVTSATHVVRKPIYERSDHRREARMAASTACRRGIDGCAPDFVQARLPRSCRNP